MEGGGKRLGLAGRLAAGLAGSLLAALLRSVGATWRREVEGLERLDELLARGEQVLAVFWHGQYLPLFILFAGHRGRIFTSRSFRGEVIAAVGRRFGYQGGPVPAAAGGKAVEAMGPLLTGCRMAALAVDGPLGPSHIVKPGAVRLASGLGFYLVPVATAARRSIVLASRWDRMEIPCPFTRVRLACGEPVQIPAGLPQEEVGWWCEYLRQRIEQTVRRARENPPADRR